MNKKTLYLVASIIILATLWVCCGQKYYANNQAIQKERFDEYDLLAQGYKNSCDVWEYNTLFFG